jgi:hypothetical protein
MDDFGVRDFDLELFIFQVPIILKHLNQLKY